jgi:hypothetical protein
VSSQPFLFGSRDPLNCFSSSSVIVESFLFGPPSLLSFVEPESISFIDGLMAFEVFFRGANFYFESF